MTTSNKPFMTVAIPTHGMENSAYFLRRLLDSLWNQTFQNFEIVVTDNSENNVIKDICEWYGSIRYVRNPIKGMAPNTNEAIRQSHGDIIKILYMDDYLLHNEALSVVVMNFKKPWLIMGADNNANPHWTEDIHLGNNKLGSPSALAIKNDNPLLFDEELTWLLDCDLYKRYYEKYGEPAIVYGKHVGIGTGPHQMTALIPDERKLSEHHYVAQKYV